MLIKLAEIDLTQPVEPIYVDPRYGQLWVVVRWGYLPLEMLRLPCAWDSRTLSTERLRSASVQVCGWKLWEHAVAGTLNRLNTTDGRAMPAISAVVCTRDRPLSLERCLQALAQLDYPTYEVVIVDNCSRDATVAQVAARSGFRYVREDTPGLD
jgi:hypothetical protein